MTPEQIDVIIKDRLNRWAKRCSEEHATPLALIAVGHDQASGQLVLCIPEGGPGDVEIAKMLRYAADLLEG